MPARVVRRKSSRRVGYTFRILIVACFGSVAFYPHGLYSNKQLSKGLVAEIDQMVSPLNGNNSSSSMNDLISVREGFNPDDAISSDNDVDKSKESTSLTNITVSQELNRAPESTKIESRSGKGISTKAVSNNKDKEEEVEVSGDAYSSCLQEAPNNQISSSLDPNRKFAYAFLIAGCDPENPSYLGYIYNILVARELLKMSGSSQDVVVLIRMYEKSNSTKLPDEHEELFTKSGIIIKYVPKPLTDNFHTAMMDKFRILELDEYDRILYLDADVIPLNNLDYMFYLSTKDQPDLAENVAIAYNNEPVNGGFFMLTPNKEDFTEIQKIIEKRELEGYDFNKTTGFGHQISPPDHWESLTSYVKELHNKDDHDNGQVTWDFYGAFTDQGLLYHWTKYVKKKLSIINGNKVQTWGSNENGELKMVSETPGEDVFVNIQRYCKIGPMHHMHVAGLSPFKMYHTAPYMDFHHFKGALKPWLKDAKRINNKKVVTLWYRAISSINKKYGYNIDKEEAKFDRPNLGLFPTHEMVMNAKKARKKDKEGQSEVQPL